MTELTTSATLQDIGSCVGGYDPKALPVAAAREFLQRLVPRLQAVEKLALRSALGRVLAEDIVSPIDVPAQDNSAMDGYAFRAADLAVAGETVFEVAGSGFAGGGVATAVGPGQCVRIMTGATMPAGLDTVVPQEFVRVDGPRIVLAAGVVRQGENRRLAGEDLARGATALAAGRLLRPADIGVLASLGRAEVPVFRRLRVAFFSTGDELRSIGEALTPGSVYDSNRYTLWAMLQRLGVDVLDLGVVRDDPQGPRGRLPHRRGRGRRGDHHRRRQRRRGRPHPDGARHALATPSSGGSRCARGGRWPSAGSRAPGAASSPSACRAIRWR